MEIKELEQKIILYNENYRKGDSLISDEEYDKLIEELKIKDPFNVLLTVGVIESLRVSDNSNDRMEKLPLQMASLEKFKDISELKKFIKNNWKLKGDDRIVITPKFDGISLCVDEWSREAWTRGDGIEGQRSDEHYESIQNGIKNPSKPGHFEYTFGEVIFPIQSFLKHKGDYKSARNCIAGLFNSPDISPMLQYARYVRYGTGREDIDKDTQLSELGKIFSNVARSWITTAATFENDDNIILSKFNELFETLQEYKCDGLVIEVSKASIRKELGRLPNGNPRYAVAFKNPEWSERAETVVKDIEWNVSKDGKVKPVLIFDPIDLCGATVQRATAHNAKYLCDNHICKNAVIIIARSGDVIPKHISTIRFNSEDMTQEMDDMMICPSCNQPLKWDSTMTEIICTNFYCKEKRIQKLVFFFNVLGIEDFGEPTIRKIYEEGFTTVNEIMKPENVKLFAKIEGLGNALVTSLLKQFEFLTKEGISLAKILTAYNVFNGVFGEKTCQMILDNLSEEDVQKVLDLEEIPIETLITIEGVGNVTAEIFNKGIKLYRCLEWDPITISLIQNKKVQAAENQISVCFSGIRNKEWEDSLTNKGHKVVSGISKNTTHLVVKDKSSTSTKTKKAQEIGIEILDVQEFQFLLNSL